MLAKVEAHSIDESEPHRLRWGSKGSFHSEECYRQLCSQSQAPARWPWKLIWKTNLPMKIKCFSWIKLNNACLTLDNLNR